MSVPFEIPQWLLDNAPPSSAPPDTSDVDPHKVEDLVNRFIAGKQAALFDAPDAYYRTTGADAVDGARAILDRLNGLKNSTLDAAGDDGTRAVLAPRLDAHLDDARDGIDRHVAAQRDILTRQIIGERQRLIQHAAILEHNNDNKLAGLAEAHASAAAELARLNGEPETPAMDAARSAIWYAAIDQRLDSGNNAQALALFDRVKGQLSSSHVLSLDEPLQVVRDDQAANQWIDNQTGTDGPPLQDRAATDPNLPPEAKLLVRAKLDARDSAQEGSRVATVKALDDRIADVTRTLATTPGAYKTGTLFRIAHAYDDAGEPEKAAATRRLAAQEGVLLQFARMGVDKQQHLIDDLPNGELRNAAIDIQRQQADAFARDPFSAGTTLYDEIGPPVPIDDVQGRLRQARQIAEMRGIPVLPFSAEEASEIRNILDSGTAEQKQAVFARLAALPDEARATLGLPGVQLAQATTGGAQPGLQPAPTAAASDDAGGRHSVAPATAWSDLSLLQKIGLAFERFDEEGKKRGGTLSADSAARRWQNVADLQRRKDAGEKLDVTQERYLLRNRNVASDLARAVGRGVLEPFARMSVDKQQRLIDDLPEGELRDAAIAVQREQADAFARDPFAAGTTLYDEVGPPVPIDDVLGRLSTRLGRSPKYAAEVPSNL